jgi:hypothetical protein
MPEEEAFCLLVRLMNHYKLRDLFIHDMPGLHMHLYQFERFLEDFEPALYCHLHRRSISPHLYATQWFLTLFAYRFPLQLVLRIYDLILSEGLSAILRFGVVLMQKNAAALLAMSDMQQLTTYLKDKVFDVYIDKDPSSGSILENGFFGSSSASIDKEVYRADQLVRDACEVKITPDILKVYAAEWEEKTKAEKEREAELESLRQSNASYAVRVRKLEERIEACDREQAVLATDLVHTKVENEELKDENESLKGQVRELRVVIEKQPAEIEEAWKLERDDLMKRNEKVHEENQKLEKEMADLEEELVQTKMRYAEVCPSSLSPCWGHGFGKGSNEVLADQLTARDSQPQVDGHEEAVRLNPVSPVSVVKVIAEGLGSLPWKWWLRVKLLCIKQLLLLSFLARTWSFVRAGIRTTSQWVGCYGELVLANE